MKCIDVCASCRFVTGHVGSPGAPASGLNTLAGGRRARFSGWVSPGYHAKKIGVNHAGTLVAAIA